MSSSANSKNRPKKKRFVGRSAQNEKSRKGSQKKRSGLLKNLIV